MHADTATGEKTSGAERKKRAGQRLLVGISGPELSAQERHLYRTIDPAGYLLPASVLQRPAYARRLTDELTHLSASGIPPHFAVDGEGGRVWRLSSKWPTPARMAGHPTLMGEVVAAMASELCAIGLNLNLAPVVERTSPMLSDRAFSRDALHSAEAAKVFIQKMQSAGVSATAKHFPGHSRHDIDPHHDTVTVDLSSEEITRTLLPPFRQAITAGVHCIMAAHSTFTKVDASAPASISSIIVPKFLRRKLGFSGVVITDDLCMAAIQSIVDYKAAVAGSTNGDIDLMLVVHSIEAQFETYEALIHQEEQNLEKTFPSSQRLNALKLKTLTHRAQPPPLSVIDSLAHRRLSEQLFQLE
jgi:beta-N-acetylhexosaminidase